MADSIDGGRVSMARQFSGLPMDPLIGGPLRAAASAQPGLAMTQAQYILNNGFDQAMGQGGNISCTPLTASIAMGRSQPVIKTDDSIITVDD